MDKQIPSFSKNTNRKYFGAGDTGGVGNMKSSSIEFSYNKPGQHYDDFGTSYKKNGFSGDSYSSSTQDDDTPTIRTKSQTMYASVIVGKSDAY